MATSTLRTVILYRSKHHGNTKKLVDAIVAAYPEVDTIDVAALGKDEYPDLTQYHLIGAASGIYHSSFDQKLKIVLEHSLSFGDKVFGLMTYGGGDKWNGRDITALAQLKFANVLTMYGCKGYDTWGPFKLVGGMNKGCPTEEDIQGAVDFYTKLVEDYGDILIEDWEKREKQREFEAANPPGGLLMNIKRTARKIAKKVNKN